MYTSVEYNTNLVEIVEKLDDNVSVVFHYTCPECGDSQVTNETALENVEKFELLQELRDNGMFLIGLPCTNCGRNAFYVDASYVEGVEVMDE